MTKKKRHKHTTTDKAKVFAQVISQQQPDAVAPSGEEIAEMMKGLSFAIGRKGQKHERRSNDTTADDEQSATDD